MDPLDGLEVRVAATLREHPACDGREISQPAARSLTVALKIATRGGPVLVKESVRPRLGVVPGVHGTGIDGLQPWLKTRRIRWTWFDRTRHHDAFALAMSVIAVLVRSDCAPAADDLCARNERASR